MYGSEVPSHLCLCRVPPVVQAADMSALARACLLGQTSAYACLGAVLQATEARAKKQAIMPSGPCRLGGSRAYRGMTPAQAAAAAAERRARDNLWCGAEHTPEEVEQEVGTGAGGSNTNSRSSSPKLDASAATAAAAVCDRVAAIGAGKQLQANGQWHPNDATPAAAAAAALQTHQDVDQVQQQHAQQQIGVQQQQQQQEANNSTLQQEWEHHLQRQRQQRQQHQPRKRHAEEVDLTLSDSEDYAAEDLAAAGEDVTSTGCPCCSGLVAISDEGAAGAVVGAASSWKAWCAGHRQQLGKQQQECQQLDQQRQENTWVCQVCTLVNKPLVLQCEACLTVRTATTTNPT